MRLIVLSLWNALGAAVLTVGLLLASEPALTAPAPSPASQAEIAYKLGSGDKLRVTVFGEDDISGQYDVDGAGIVRLPLIGQVQAGGRTLVQFEDEVRAKLADGFLVNPRVSAEVINYRPFYILGEVGRPGEYPYVNGMTILNAVALAGGYTPRANTRSVYVRRNGDSKEVYLPADETTRIGPGDLIRVAERLF